MTASERRDVLELARQLCLAHAKEHQAALVEGIPKPLDRAYALGSVESALCCAEAIKEEAERG